MPPDLDRHERARKTHERAARSQEWAASFWDPLKDRARAEEAQSKAQLLRHAAEREAGRERLNRERS